MYCLVLGTYRNEGKFDYGKDVHCYRPVFTGWHPFRRMDDAISPPTETPSPSWTESGGICDVYPALAGDRSVRGVVRHYLPLPHANWETTNYAAKQTLG